MDGQPVRPGFHKLLHIPDGTVNHQVNIQRQIRHRTDGLHHRNADGNIGHKQPVHHIHMNPVSAVAADIPDVPLQIRKIRR